MIESGVDVAGLEGVIRRTARTHIGSMASGQWQDDEIVRRALASMTPEQRQKSAAIIAEAVEWLRRREAR